MNDARLLAWKAMFDTDVTFDAVSTPAGMVDLLAPRTGSTERGLFVSGMFEPTPNGLAGYQRVVVMNGPRALPGQLRAAGFPWVRRFGILPGVHDPRFLIPLESAGGASRALRLYSPITLRGRLARRGAMTLARTSLYGWYRDHITIATREQPAIERRLQELLGVDRPSLVFSTGRPLAQSKHTIGVQDGHGTWRAFIKDAEGSWARPALQNEAAWLRTLRQSAARDTVPELLAEDESSHGLRLIMSAGPEQSAPMRFGDLHRGWLTNLKANTSTPGTLEQSSLAVRMVDDWPKMKQGVPAIWQERLARAYRVLQQLLDSQVVCLSASHGDFTPWNTRRFPDGRLFVFDWEMARDRSLPLRDLYHFHFMIALTLGKGLHPSRTAAWVEEKARAMPDRVNRSLLAPLFLAYLIDLALDYLGMLTARDGQNDDAVLTTIAQHLDHMDWWLKP
jgi:hypothetical protein